MHFIMTCIYKMLRTNKFSSNYLNLNFTYTRRLFAMFRLYNNFCFLWNVQALCSVELGCVEYWLLWCIYESFLICWYTTAKIY